MNSSVPNSIEEDSIDIKTILEHLYANRVLISICVIIFTLISTYYAYFQPNIYRSTASVKVGLDEDQYRKDVVSMAMGKGAVNSSTEKDMIQSRYLAQKALKFVDFREHYYTKIHFRKIELYKNSPIRVDMIKGYGLLFKVTIIDNKRYRLLLDDRYNKINYFDKKVKTNDFELTIHRVGKTTQKEYSFSIDKKSKVFGSVSVDQDFENSTILQIHVEDSVALRAKEYANALAKAYVEQNIESKSREATQRVSFIDAQLKNITFSIKDASSKLERFRKVSKIVNVETKMKVISTRLDENEGLLSNLLIREAMVKTFYRDLKLNRRVESLSVEGLEDKESSLSHLMNKLHDALIEKKSLEEDYTNLHPLVIRVNHKISEIKSIVIHTVKNILFNIRKHIKLVSKNIKDEKKILNRLPKNARIYGQLDSKFKMNEEIYAYLLKRRSEAEMVRASTVSKNRLLDKALLPRTPVKPKRVIIVLIGIVLGFIVGLLLSALKIMLDTKIKNENDISKIVTYPILGVIPTFNNSNNSWKSNIKVMESINSVVSESFRHLRSSLQFLVNHKKSKIILVTSTIGQEGKTTISVNLGAIISLRKKRTVIINIDMRKPTLHDRFNLPNKKGLSELLNGRVDLKSILQHTKYDNLDIISSGVVPPNPSELIQTKKMYKVLYTLKNMYDYIILDTPPIGLVTDAKELMLFADINIFIVRADYSKKEFLENLKKYDFLKYVKTLGIVLNDFNVKEDHYGDYYYSYGYNKDL